MSDILTVCNWLSKPLKHKVFITGRSGAMAITNRSLSLQISDPNRTITVKGVKVK